MNIYMTSGTYDFLESIAKKHPLEMILTLQDGDGAVLLHETSGESVFSSPRKYEVIDSAGELKRAGFIVMNNIPVTDEGRPLFEYRFKNRARMIEQEPGFAAIRVLRPMNSNTYIILTQWDSEKDFEGWQQSKAYEKAHEKRGTSEGIDAQPQIFAMPAHVTKYHVSE
jgi:heme-degrading monooxygenase HmoA